MAYITLIRQKDSSFKKVYYKPFVNFETRVYVDFLPIEHTFMQSIIFSWFSLTTKF